MSKDSYRFIAAIYDHVLEPLNKGLRGLGLRLRPPQPGMKVLDVCCGTGIHLKMYHDKGCEIHGVDLSPAMLAVAQRRLGQHAALSRADATSLPYGDGLFDLVLCMLALHEMTPEARDIVIGEMNRVMRPDGEMLLIDFHPGPFHGMKGFIANSIITIAEYFAGGEHYANSRIFLRSGGLTPHLERAGLLKSTERIVGGGTLSVTVCRKESR